MSASASAVVPIRKRGVSMRLSGSINDVAPIVVQRARGVAEVVDQRRARRHASSPAIAIPHRQLIRAQLQLARDATASSTPRAELVDRAGIGREAALALGEVADRQVEEHLRRARAPASGA